MKCTAFEEIETNSFDGVEGGYDEPTVIDEGENVEHEEAEENNEDDDEEKHVVGEITLPDTWAEGKFEVNINRCLDCNHHYNYCRHSEDEYINIFNEIGDAILGLFTNATITGNYERPGFLGEFEVYIRGIGFKSQRDNTDRFFLYRKSQRGRFP